MVLASTAVISRQEAAAIVGPLRDAVGSLLQVYSIAHAAPPLELRPHMQLLSYVTASAKGMLLAVWQAYPDLDPRDGSETLDELQVATTFFEWTKQWRWRGATGERVVQDRLLQALRESNEALALARATFSGGTSRSQRRFERELSTAMGVVQALGGAVMNQR